MGDTPQKTITENRRYHIRTHHGHRFLPNIKPKPMRLIVPTKCMKTLRNGRSSLPLLWTSALFGEALPFMTHNRVDGLISVTSLVWMYGNSKYISGYLKSPEDRIFGFRIRTRTTIVWLVVSSLSLGCTSLQRFYIVD